jgi:hypothetical protein
MRKFLLLYIFLSFFIFSEIKISIDKPVILKLERRTGIYKDEKEDKEVQTICKIFSDGQNLIFSFDCKEPLIKNIKTEKKENDTEIWQDDSVEIFIQTEIDKDDYFQIVVNAIGKIYDKYLSGSITEWDSKADVRTKINDDGYAVEIKLPISSLKFDPEKNIWRINLCRNRKPINQYYTFCGWYHKYKEWEKFDLSEIELSKIKSNPVFPVNVYTYDTGKLKDLNKKLKWIIDERIRIYCGWLTGIERRPEHTHTIYQVIDKISECKFNLITLRYYPYNENPSLNGESLIAALYAKKKGLKVIFHLGYIANVKNNYQLLINSDGSPIKFWANYLPSLFDENFWEDRFYKLINEIIEFERKENINIFDGILFDIEPYREGRLDLDFSDIVFYEFLKRENIDEKVDYKKRKVFLLKKNLIEKYRNFCEEYLAEKLSKFRDKIHKDKEIFFCIYPFNDWYLNPERSWWQVGVCKGLGKKEIPFFVWDDNCYWTGFTGNQKLPQKGQEFLREKLGYEGIFLTSIDYITYPNYPQYTPEKAGEEYYYLVRTGPGCWLYGENNPEKGSDIWKNHLPYWEYFKKANERLYEEKIIKKIEPDIPDKKEIERIDRIIEKIKKRMRDQWLVKSGKPYYYSDPVAEKIEDDGKIIFIKNLNGYEKHNCDFIYNGTSSTYNFEIPDIDKFKNFYLEIEGRVPFKPERGIVIVKINGNEIERKKWETNYIKNRWKIEKRYLKEKNEINISYFDGENPFETIYDTNFLVKSIKMELEK